MMGAPNTATVSGAPIAPTSAKSNLTSRSTATEAQLQRIVEALRISPKTTGDLRKIGVYQVSARIWGLRAMGYVIDTTLFDGYADDGYSHARMARYTLLSEPLPLAPDSAQPCGDAATTEGA